MDIGRYGDHGQHASRDVGTRLLQERDHAPCHKYVLEELHAKGQETRRRAAIMPIHAQVSLFQIKLDPLTGQIRQKKKKILKSFMKNLNKHMLTPQCQMTSI